MLACNYEPFVFEEQFCLNAEQTPLPHGPLTSTVVGLFIACIVGLCGEATSGGQCGIQCS